MPRIQSGDPSAFSTFFDRYIRIVRGIAYQVLRDRAEAEELAQEVFLYIHQKARLFDASRGSAKAWLVQVAYHKAFDRRAYLSRRRFYDGTDFGEIGDNVEGTFDIEQKLDAHLGGRHLRKAFEQLTERQRTTLELFFFQGFNLREISQQLDEPLENVRHHYYRALKKLKTSAALAGLRKV